MRSKTMVSLIIAGLGLLAMAGTSRAESILVQYVSGSGVGAGPFTYTYNVFLTPGNTLTTNPPADYFVIVDVEGLIGGTATFTAVPAPPAFTPSFSFTQGGTAGNPLPPPGGTIAPDDGMIDNLVGQYTGPSPLGGTPPLGGSTVLLGQLTFQSTVGSIAFGQQGGSDTMGGTGANGANIDPTLVPTSLSRGGFVPLPKTAWAGSSLLGLTALVRWRTSRKRAA